MLEAKLYRTYVMCILIETKNRTVF